MISPGLEVDAGEATTTRDPGAALARLGLAARRAEKVKGQALNRVDNFYVGGRRRDFLTTFAESCVFC
jgi:hypothetical protein